MPGTRASMLLGALLATCLVAGCSHNVTVGSDRALHMALSEYRLRPQSVRASAGQLTIYVRNYGRLTHNLVISHDGQTIGSIKPLPPGQSAALTLYLTSGSYSMASTMLSDQALGAYGTLKVAK